jgi:hypothetical protein
MNLMDTLGIDFLLVNTVARREASDAEEKVRD